MTGAGCWYVASVYESARAVSHSTDMDAAAARAKKMEAVARLAAGVAHDFNNILQVIQGFADFLLGKTTAEDPFRKPLQQIRQSAAKAADLTQHLVVIGLKESQNPEVLDLGLVVQDTGGFLREVVGPGITVNLRSEDGLWKVRADRGHFEHVLTHLAQNAREAMEGEGELAIETGNLAGNDSPGQPRDGVRLLRCSG